MTLGSALLIIALFLFVVAFVARPLITGAGARVTEAERHLSELLAARDHTLSSLADLEMDNVLQKIPPEDYAAERAELLQKGAEILRQIDTLADEGLMEAAAVVSVRSNAKDPEAELEAAVARMRAGDEAPTGGEAPSDGFCPRCGEPVVASDRFCSHCGAALTTEGSRA
jgi:hypothetical protein